MAKNACNTCSNQGIYVLRSRDLSLQIDTDYSYILMELMLQPSLQSLLAVIHTKLICGFIQTVPIWLQRLILHGFLNVEAYPYIDIIIMLF